MLCYLCTVMVRWEEFDEWVWIGSTPPINHNMDIYYTQHNNGHLLQQYILLADPTEFLG